MQCRVKTAMSVHEPSPSAHGHPTRRKPSLAEQLATFHAAMLARMAPGDAAAVRQYEQSAAAAGAAMPAAGDAAPDFTLLDQHGRPVHLADRLALGPVVLVFIRGGWCPLCTLALRAWADVLPSLHDAGGDLLAVSPQPVPACGGVAECNLLPYPVLSDWDGAVAAAYGVDWDVPEADQALHRRLGHDVLAGRPDGRWRAPLPAVFVVGRHGRVTLAHADRVPAQRLDPAFVIGTVRAAAGQVGDRAT